MWRLRCNRIYLIVISAAVTFVLMPQDGIGDDAELREQANSLFGVIKAADDEAVNAPASQLGRALFLGQANFG